MESELTGLTRCPHCGVANPTFKKLWASDGPIKGAVYDGNSDFAGVEWATYKCTTCGKVVLTASSIVLFVRDGRGNVTGLDRFLHGEAAEVYPSLQTVDQNIPERARRYLEQAIEAVSSPDGAVMLCASSVDAMLKAKSFVAGGLYSRIKLAVEQNVLTQDMAEWAHKVRLDATDPRHADDDRPHLSQEDAKQAIKFTQTLGEILFVLPARISAGLAPIVAK